MYMCVLFISNFVLLINDKKENQGQKKIKCEGPQLGPLGELAIGRIELGETSLG